MSLDNVKKIPETMKKIDYSRKRMDYHLRLPVGASKSDIVIGGIVYHALAAIKLVEEFNKLTKEDPAALHTEIGQAFIAASLSKSKIKKAPELVYV